MCVCGIWVRWEREIVLHVCGIALHSCVEFGFGGSACGWICNACVWNCIACVCGIWVRWERMWVDLYRMCVELHCMCAWHSGSVGAQSVKWHHRPHIKYGALRYDLVDISLGNGVYADGAHVHLGAQAEALGHKVNSPISALGQFTHFVPRPPPQQLPPPPSLVPPPPRPPKSHR
jgi:hypothetical protein